MSRMVVHERNQFLWNELHGNLTMGSTGPTDYWSSVATGSSHVTTRRRIVLVKRTFQEEMRSTNLGGRREVRTIGTSSRSSEEVVVADGDDGLRWWWWWWLLWWFWCRWRPGSGGGYRWLEDDIVLYWLVYGRADAGLDRFASLRAQATGVLIVGWLWGWCWVAWIIFREDMGIGVVVLEYLLRREPLSLLLCRGILKFTKHLTDNNRWTSGGLCPSTVDRLSKDQEILSGWWWGLCRINFIFLFNKNNEDDEECQ